LSKSQSPHGGRGLDGSTVLNAMSAPAAVLDGDGCIVAVNDAWIRFALDNGGAIERVGLGINYFETCGGDAAEIADGIRSVIARDRDLYTTEYPCHSPSEDRWFRLTVTPLGTGALVIHVDITGEYLRVSRWLSRSAVALVELGPELEATFVNDSWRSVAGIDEWTRPIHPADAAVLADRLIACLADREPFTIDLRVHDGWYRFAVQIETSSGGEVIGVVLTGVDITDQSAAIRDVAALEERLKLAAELHDTVVQGLYGTALSLQRHADTGYAQPLVVDDAIARLDRSIGELRELSHPAARARHHDLLATLSAAIDDARAALGFDPDVSIDLAETSPDPATVNQLRAVLSEGLSNVARHAGATACQVELTHLDGLLTLTISDNGCGMPSEPGRSSGTEHIRGRAHLLGGRAQWSPAPAGGTRLTWQVPLVHASREQPNRSL
jgi:signal transduction histidine kinase